MENDVDDMEVVGFCCCLQILLDTSKEHIHIHISNVCFRQCGHADIKMKDVLLSLHVVSQISAMLFHKCPRCLPQVVFGHIYHPNVIEGALAGGLNSSKLTNRHGV